MKTFNRILSMLLVIAMVMSIAVMGVVAEEATTQNCYSGEDLVGQETWNDGKDDWIVIDSAEDFPSTTKVDNAKYILACDLDFNGTEFPSSGIKLGKNTIFEGNGYSLLNFHLGNKNGEGADAGTADDTSDDGEETSATSRSEGMFSLSAGVQIRNLTCGAQGAAVRVSNSLIERNHNYDCTFINVDAYVVITRNGGNPGAFFSNSSGGKVVLEDCDLSISWLGDTTPGFGEGNSFGGFIGARNGGSVTFKNCTVNADNLAPTGCGYVGGFVGSSTGPISFVDCSVTGIISGGLAVGGYIGETSGTTNFTKSNSAVTLTSKDPLPANSKKILTMGGLIGHAKNGTVSVNNGVYSGTINTTRANNGGFVGTATQGTVSIANSVYNGSIDATAANNGGFVGAITGGTTVITNSSTASTSSIMSTDLDNGGFVGYATSSAIVEIASCVNSASVTIDIGNVGYGCAGFVAKVTGQSVITVRNSTNNGIVKGKQNGGGGNSLAGFIGYVGSNTTAYVLSCVNSEDASNEGNKGAYGGMVGLNTGIAYIDGCINNANIYSTTGRAGGMLGYNSSGEAVITNCTNNGAITDTQRAAGIVSRNTGTVTIQNCVNNGAIHNTTKYRVGGILADSSGKATLIDCTNTGTLTGVAGNAIGEIVGGVSGTLNVLDCTGLTDNLIGSGSKTGDATRPTMTYNAQTYDIVNGKITVGETVYNVIEYAYQLAQLANEGNYVLASDFKLGTVYVPYAVGNNVLLDGNGHSLTNIVLPADATLFTFVAGNTATFKNLTFGSAETPVDAWAAVVTYAYTADDVDVENNANGQTNKNDAAKRNASVGAFNTNWINVNAYATLQNVSLNQGAFFAGNVEGTHTFTNCHATVTLAAEQTQQGNQVAAFIGRNKNGNVSFTDCTANGTIAAAAIGAGFIAKSDSDKNVCFVNCTNNATIQSSTATTAAGFVGTVGNKTVISFTDCMNNANVTVQARDSDAAGFVVASAGVSNKLQLVNCINTADISAYDQAGGLVGTVGGTVSISDCVNSGDVTSANNQAVGIHVGSDNAVVLIQDTVNEGTITSKSWAAGFVRRDKQVTIVNCINKGAINGAAGYSTQFVARQTDVSKAENLVIRNSYAFGTVNGDASASAFTSAQTSKFTFVDVLYVSDEDLAIEGAINVTEEFKNTIMESSTLHTIKGVQETKAEDRGYATDVYDVRILAGLDTYEYDNITFVVNITMGSYTNTLTLDVKKVFEKVTAADGDNSGNVTEVAASEFGANYFAAIVITDVPTGVADVVFEVTTYVTENGVTYQMGKTATVVYDANGNFVEQ